MAVLTVNNQVVASGTVNLPLVGRATAILEFHALEPPFQVGELVTLQWYNGQRHKMSVNDYTMASGVYRGIFLAGKELNTIVREQYYFEATIGTIARAIISEVGGTPGDIDIPVLLNRYVRRRSPAHTALNHLVYGRGLIWRVLEDGRVWVGKNNPEKRGPFRIREVKGKVITMELAPDLKPGDILEGYLDGTIQTFGVVKNIMHFLDGANNELRTEAYV